MFIYLHYEPIRAFGRVAHDIFILVLKYSCMYSSTSKNTPRSKVWAVQDDLPVVQVKDLGILVALEAFHSSFYEDLVAGIFHTILMAYLAFHFLHSLSTIVLHANLFYINLLDLQVCSNKTFSLSQLIGKVGCIYSPVHPLQNYFSTYVFSLDW